MSNPQINFKIFSSFEEITSLQNEWDAFVESVFGDVYLSFDWCRIWWKCYGENRLLRIYVFYQSETIVGLFPVFIDKIWLGPVWLKMTKFIGADSTLSIVHPPVRSNIAFVAFNLLITDLFRGNYCDTLLFGPLGAIYRELQQLRDAVKGNQNAQLIQDIAKSTYTTFFLPDTFDEYIRSLHKRQRGNTRRDLNLIDKSFVMSHDVVEDADIADIEFKKFIEMHTRQWKSVGKLGHFNDWPKGIEFNSQMVVAQARKKRLRLLRLLADGKVVSYQLCYVFGKRWYWRLPARVVGDEWNKYALGRIGLIKEIEWAIEEGAQEIEAGEGHYDYKVKLGGEEHALHSILLAQNNMLCKLRTLIFLKVSEALNFFYYRVWFKRIAPKLPMKRRPLWRKWIITRL